MRNRVELLALIARTAERLVLWTHVYDRDVVAGKPLVAARLAAGTAAEVDGFRYALYRHEYSTDLFSRALSAARRRSATGSARTTCSPPSSISAWR